MRKVLLTVAALALMTAGASAAEYAAVKAGAILERRDFASPPPDMTRKGFAWLPVTRTDPAYDPATQVKTGPVTTVNATDVSDVWSVRAKTAPELDAEKVVQVEQIAVAIVRALCNHESRIRTLASQPSVTFQQCKDALKSLIP